MDALVACESGCDAKALGRLEARAAVSEGIVIAADGSHGGDGGALVRGAREQGFERPTRKKFDGAAYVMRASTTTASVSQLLRLCRLARPPQSYST